jgi:hypothetical protein
MEFFLDELLEKKVYLVDMSIISIILSPEPKYHSRRVDALSAMKGANTRRSNEEEEVVSMLVVGVIWRSSSDILSPLVNQNKTNGTL